MNKGKLDQFNETNFSPTIIFHMAPENVVGIADVKAYYAHFRTGFFEIKEVFGQGNKLTKHWVFSGKHTGDFFGIAATGRSVKLESSTIVRMENGARTRREGGSWCLACCVSLISESDAPPVSS